MNDLQKLLREASEPDDGWHLAADDLLASGRRTVRRRRLAAGAGVAAAVVTAAAVLATGPMSGGDEPDVVDQPGEHPSAYEEVRISPSEVERRCTAILNRQEGTDARWVAGRAEDGTAVPAETTGQRIETREGHLVDLAVEGETWTPRNGLGGRGEVPGSGAGGGTGGPSTEAICQIPQADLVDGVPAAQAEPLPAADDEPAVLDLCSRRTAFDVRGWEVVAAAETSSGLVAMVMAENGYFATCSLGTGGDDLEIDPTRWLDESGEPVGTDADIAKSAPAVACGAPSGGPTECTVYGVLPGLPDGYRVEARDPRGEVLGSATTEHGAFVLVYGGSGVSTQVRILAPGGKVLWDSGLSAGSGGL